MVRKPTDFVQFKLRIRESLRRKLEKEAEKKATSANNEAVERLEQSFHTEQRISEARARIDELQERIEEIKTNVAASQQQAIEQKEEAMHAVQRLTQQQVELSAKLNETKRELDKSKHEVDKFEASWRIVDILIGKDEQKSSVLRRVALEVAGWHKDWWTDREGRKDSEARLLACIQESFADGETES
jgi:seryl-tRNA synthetase